MALVKIGLATQVEAHPAGTPAIDRYDLVIGSNPVVSLKKGDTVNFDFADGDTSIVGKSIDVNGNQFGADVVGVYTQVASVPVQLDVLAGFTFEPVVPA